MKDFIKEILLASGSASDASDKENFVVCFHGCMVCCIMAGLFHLVDAPPSPAVVSPLQECNRKKKYLTKQGVMRCSHVAVRRIEQQPEKLMPVNFPKLKTQY